MKNRYLYCLVAVAGTIVPYVHFKAFLIENGLDSTLFIDEVTGTPIASFFTRGDIISTMAVIGLILYEGRRLKIRGRWLSIRFNLAVRVSLALPSFLYARQLKLDK